MWLLTILLLISSDLVIAEPLSNDFRANIALLSSHCSGEKINIICMKEIENFALTGTFYNSNAKKISMETMNGKFDMGKAEITGVEIAGKFILDNLTKKFSYE